MHQAAGHTDYLNKHRFSALSIESVADVSGKHISATQRKWSGDDLKTAQLYVKWLI